MKMNFVLNVAIALCIICSCNVLASESVWYRSVIPDNYTKEVSPAEKVEVQLSMYFLQFYDYDEKTKQISADMYLRFHWQDPRLQNPNVSFKKCLVSSPTLKENIWVPDIFIVNAVKYELAGGPNTFVRINQTDGSVLFSQKVQIRIPCKFSSASTDVTCEYLFESYGHNVDTMALGWKSEPGYSSENIYSPKINLEGMTHHKSDTITVSNATYNRLSVTFKFKKDLEEYVRNLIAHHGH